MARAEVAKDYYSILEVSQSATFEAIRESYRKLALRFHPDKNKGESATSDFQLLAIAWDTLKDTSKRAQYDRDCVRSAKRKLEEAEKYEAERARRRRQEVDQEARAQWRQENVSAQSVDELERQERAQAWKAIAREDYLSRLQSWSDFRKEHLVLIQECQRLIHKQELYLNDQTKEDQENVIRMFHDAIERSRSSGHQIHDYATTLSRLLEARKNFILKLGQTIAESRKRSEKLFAQLETRRRRYEEEEAKARQGRIQQALQLLGPRGLNPPLFSILDRRGRAINYWRALSRVKSGSIFPTSLKEASEGPWHLAAEWKRVDGEHTCGRCNQPTFHIIPECRPARCPGCGMIACNDCYRDLRLLREYEDWVVSPPGALKESLFSIAFDFGVEPAGT